jgi:hypothetical protein
MIDNRRPHSWLYWIALAVGSSGCSEELGPERMIVTHVNGVVREGQSPVSRGWIEFMPLQSTVGNIRSTKIRADGTFEAERVSVGVNLIRLANAPLGSVGAEQLFGSYQSPIRRTIPLQPQEPLVIDVLDEVILYKAARARAAEPKARGSGEPR